MPLPEKLNINVRFGGPEQGPPGQEKRNVGLLTLFLTIDDLIRVREQLERLVGKEALRCTGPLTDLRANWPQQLTLAMIYLELDSLSGTWNAVLDWCQAAYRVGLLTSYHYADIGLMFCIDPDA